MGWFVMAWIAASSLWSLNTMSATACRSSSPSVRTMASPQRSTIATKTGRPGCCSSRESRSTSMITASRSARRAPTVDFPDPIPPVSPASFTAGRGALRPSGTPFVVCGGTVQFPTRTTSRKRGHDRDPEPARAAGALRDDAPGPRPRPPLLRPGVLRPGSGAACGRGSGRWRAGWRRSRSRATTSSTRSSTSR